MNNSTLTLTIRANVSALQAGLKAAQASVKSFTRALPYFCFSTIQYNTTVKLPARRPCFL